MKMRLMLMTMLSALVPLMVGCDRSGAPVQASAADTHDHGHEDHAGHEDGSDDHDHDEEAQHVDEVTLTPEAIERHGIRIEPVDRHVLTRTIMAPAQVSFNMERMAHIGTPLVGRVAELKVRLGESVARGDVLMVLDSPELGQAQSEFLLKQAALATAAPTVALAKDTYERAKSLYESSQGIALSEVQKREAEFRAAQGAVTAAKAEATAAENRLHLLGVTQAQVEAIKATGEVDSRSSVRSPIDGVVVAREATLGELVGPQRDALMVIADMSTLWVVADVPEGRLADVAVGSPTEVTVPSTADATIQGHVAYIAPQLDPATRTAAVRIEVEGDARLRPGMFARVTLHARSDGESVLAVPEEAVQMVEGQTSVFVPVAGEPNTFATRSVKVGPRVDRMVPVLAGLEAGEPIVVAGSFILKADLGKAGAAHEH